MSRGNWQSLRETRVRWLTPIEAAWVGALFEGEGTLDLRRYQGRGKPERSWQVHARVVSTSVETIATLLRLTGAGTICAVRRMKPHHKQAWAWSIGSIGDAVCLLGQIHPYLTDKKEKALVIFHTLRCTPIRLGLVQSNE